MIRPKLATFIIATGVALLVVAASTSIALADPLVPSEVPDVIVTTVTIADDDLEVDSLTTEAVTPVLPLDPLEGIVPGSDIPGGLTEAIVPDDPIGGLLPDGSLIPALPPTDTPTDSLPPINIPDIASPGGDQPAENPGVTVQPSTPFGNSPPTDPQGPAIAYSQAKARPQKAQTTVARRLDHSLRDGRGVQDPGGASEDLPGSSEASPSGGGPIHQLQAALSGEGLFSPSALRDSVIALAMAAPILFGLWIWLRQERLERAFSPALASDESDRELPLASRMLMKVIAYVHDRLSATTGMAPPGFPLRPYPQTPGARGLARVLRGPFLVFFILFAVIAIARLAWIF